MKNTFPTLFIGSALLLTPTNVFAATSPAMPEFFHRGEIPPIEYWIEYEASLGVTTANALGIVYVPYGFEETFEPTILPERYFGDYPLYFADAHFAFVVHIKNTGERTYRNLRVVATQEFLNTEGGAGEPFPGDSPRTWFLPTLLPGEEVALRGSMTLPMLQSSGIDQTHLQIFHWDGNAGDRDHAGLGRILLDDPQAGLWCPLSID